MIFALSLCLLAAAPSDTWPRPRVEYSAEARMSARGIDVHGKIFVTPDKERREHAFPGATQVIIVRRDRGLVWVLLPEDKTYIEVELAGAPELTGELPAGSTVVKRKSGAEDVGGAATTRYKVRVAQPSGAGLAGTIWVDADDIIRRLEAKTFGSGPQVALSMGVEHVAKGPQDPSLFELPAEYRRIETPVGKAH